MSTGIGLWFFWRKELRDHAYYDYPWDDVTWRQVRLHRRLYGARC